MSEPIDVAKADAAGKLYQAFWEALGWVGFAGEPMPPSLFDRREAEIRAWIAVLEAAHRT